MTYLLTYKRRASLWCDSWCELVCCVMAFSCCVSCRALSVVCTTSSAVAVTAPAASCLSSSNCFTASCFCIRDFPRCIDLSWQSSTWACLCLRPPCVSDTVYVDWPRAYLSVLEMWDFFWSWNRKGTWYKNTGILTVNVLNINSSRSGYKVLIRILFTLLLVHLILQISPHHSHHLRSHHISLPRPFSPDLSPLELHLTTSELWFGQEQEGILP